MLFGLSQSYFVFSCLFRRLCFLLFLLYSWDYSRLTPGIYFIKCYFFWTLTLRIGPASLLTVAVTVNSLINLSNKKQNALKQGTTGRQVILPWQYFFIQGPVCLETSTIILGPPNLTTTGMSITEMLPRCIPNYPEFHPAASGLLRDSCQNPVCQL